MDQEAFRVLLASGASSSVPRAEPHWPPKRKHKEKEVTTSKPAFKPRTHNNSEEKYRDRATERRGGANDYADVERVLADFEKVNAGMEEDMVEEQRKYLGGDEKHTVLVKGLDFALLEQQRAKLDSKQNVEDEMLLEEAFQTVSAPKKRTREEIVAELKKSRAVAAPVDTSLETAKHSGKFRPIGAPTDVKAKKRKIKDAEESEKKKKKKRKVEEESQLTEGTSAVRLSGPKEDVKMDISPSKQQLRQRTPSPEVDVDADIFADAEEWQGLGSDSESDGEVSARPRKPEVTPKAPPETIVSKPGTNWFGEKVEEKPKDIPKQEFKEIAASEEREEKEEEPERPMRLQGLASSAVPSIREILAMDKAAEKEEKRKARKEKKKEKKPSEETKINREAKELEKYVATRGK